MRLKKTETKRVNCYVIEKARKLKTIFSELKKQMNTTVSKNSSGMVWKGDVLWRLGRNSKGDFVELGFSYNPYDDEMTIYETYSKNKVLIDSVDDFKDALKELGIEDDEITYVTQFLSV